jgi:hypothetical protein
MDISDQDLREYLLGGAQPGTAEAIDLRLISDPEFEDRIIHAESSLAEDYLEGSLSGPDRGRFLTNFLVTNDRKQLVEDISALKAYAKNAARGEVARPSVTLLSAVQNWLSAHMRLAGAATAILVVAIAFAAWKVVLSRRDAALSPVEQEYAAVNRELSRGAAVPSNLSTIGLVSERFRSGGPGQRHSFDSLTDRVFVRLSLPYEPKAGTEFNFEVVKDGSVTFRQTGIPVYREGTAPEVRLLLPRTALGKGDLQLRLNETRGTDSPLDYGLFID